MSEEKVGSFVAGLAGLPKEELKKAKVLFIKNVIAEYKAARESYDAFLWIPVLGWAAYLLNFPMMSANFNGMKTKIRNAIDIWKDDLAGESFVIDNETIQL